MTFKGFGEGEGISIADGIGNILDGMKALCQHFAGLFHAVGKKVFLQSIAGCFLEKFGKVAALKAACVSNVIHTDWLTVFNLNIVYNSFHI